MLEFRIAKETQAELRIGSFEGFQMATSDNLPVIIDVLAYGRSIYSEDAFTWSPIHEEEIVEALKGVEIEIDGYQIDAGTAFVAGGCSVLANALVSLLPRTHVIAVYDAVDEDGEELAVPHLIHAGLVIPEGQVLDINGAMDRDRWFDQWSELGLECNLHEWEPGVAPFAEGDGGPIAETFAFALSVACARSVGLLSRSGPEQAPVL